MKYADFDYGSDSEVSEEEEQCEEE